MIRYYYKSRVRLYIERHRYYSTYVSHFILNTFVRKYSECLWHVWFCQVTHLAVLYVLLSARNMLPVVLCSIIISYCLYPEAYSASVFTLKHIIWLIISWRLLYVRLCVKYPETYHETKYILKFHFKSDLDTEAYYTVDLHMCILKPTIRRNFINQYIVPKTAIPCVWL